MFKRKSLLLTPSSNVKFDPKKAKKQQSEVLEILEKYQQPLFVIAGMNIDEVRSKCVVEVRNTNYGGIIYNSETPLPVFDETGMKLK